MHKAQQFTLESAVIEVGSKKMENLYYVASRRVQSMSQVYLKTLMKGVIKFQS